MMNYKKMLFALLICLAGLSSTTLIGQSRKESVILIPLLYENSNWKSLEDSIIILPCPPPSKVIKVSADNPLIILKGKDQKVLFKQHIYDPRIILPEDAEGEYKLLDKIEFSLRLPLVQALHTFEFYYDPEKADEPTISIDLSEKINEYKRTGGEQKKAPCQEPEYSDK